MRWFLLAMFMVSTVFAQDPTPWCGSYDADPEYYLKNKRLSEISIGLDNVYIHEYIGYLACINWGDWKTGPHAPHSDHSYNIDGHNLYITCWNRHQSDNKLRKVGEVIGLFNEDFTELKVQNYLLKKVDDAKRSIPGVPGTINNPQEMKHV